MSLGFKRLKRFINCRSRHIPSGLPNYEGRKINANMEEAVGFVVDTAPVNIFFFQYFGLFVVTMIKLNFHNHDLIFV